AGGGGRLPGQRRADALRRHAGAAAGRRLLPQPAPRRPAAAVQRRPDPGAERGPDPRRPEPGATAGGDVSPADRGRQRRGGARQRHGRRRRGGGGELAAGGETTGACYDAPGWWRTLLRGLWRLATDRSGKLPACPLGQRASWQLAATTERTTRSRPRLARAATYRARHDPRSPARDA